MRDNSNRKTWRKFSQNSFPICFVSKYATRVSKGVKDFEIDDNKRSVRTNDKGIKIFAWKFIKNGILYIKHYSLLASHQGGRKLYYKTWNYFHCPALAVNCGTSVQICLHSALNRLNLRNIVAIIKLFSIKEQLRSVCLHIYGQLIRTSWKNEHVIVITDRFSKMPKTVPCRVSPQPKLRSTLWISGCSRTAHRGS